MAGSRVPGTSRAPHRGKTIACATFLLLGSLAVHAEPVYLALIIDDLGYSLREGEAVVSLPAPVNGAVLPHTPHGRAIAEQLHRHGRDVLLHLPMQPLEALEAGPGALTLGMSAREVAITIDYDLATVPHVVGINNHMGSGLTQDLTAMRQLMQHIQRQGDIFFLDSFTDARSVARQAAQEYAVPFLARDVFLDSDRTIDAVRGQLARVVVRARHTGAAVAIGHPYPETLAVLRESLPALHEQGIELVSVSRLLKYKSARAAQDAPVSRRPGWPGATAVQSGQFAIPQ